MLKYILNWSTLYILMTIKHTLDVDADVIICNFQDIMIIKVEPKCQEI